MKARTALTALMVAVALAGCASGHTTTRTTAASAPAAPRASSTVARPAGASVYETIVTPANDASHRFNCGLDGLAPDADAEDLAKLAEPMADALERANNRLVATTWAPDVQPDARALVRDIALLVGDLRTARTVTAFNAKDWSATLGRHAETVRASVNIVRVDLGLAPKSQGQDECR